MNSFNVEDLFEKMYKIVGCAMDLYNELGYGYSERVYQECLSILCSERDIPWEREKKLDMFFHQSMLKQKYYADFVCYDNIIVEIKAADTLVSEHRAQLFNYLRITNSPGGILINFGNPERLTSEKYIYDSNSNSYVFVRNLDDLKTPYL